MECGIIGLPNVGKSTLFNALTATAAAQAANYPFCTIEPNVGTVDVPDPRIEKLALLAQSQRVVPAQITFIDIAGLVRGASQGGGLGNQFLGHIRQVQAIVHVVRCFEGDTVHVEGRVDPIADIDIIETELLLADLESIERRLSKKKKDPEIDPLLYKAKEMLDQGKWASKALWTPEEKILHGQLGLLTLKPVLYVCNVSESSLSEGGGPLVEAVRAHVQGACVLSVCSQLEAEVSLLDPSEKGEFLKEMGLLETGLSQIIRASYQQLQLMTFFTVGPKEVHAWTLSQKGTAFDAAGAIHSDFQTGFIRAEIVSYQDFLTYGSFAEAKESGKLRSEGRDYVMQDGDIALFRFNV